VVRRIAGVRPVDWRRLELPGVGLVNLTDFLLDVGVWEDVCWFAGLRAGEIALDFCDVLTVISDIWDAACDGPKLRLVRRSAIGRSELASIFLLLNTNSSLDNSTTKVLW
jgi:hypothetical protein